mmetsp:Transcript_46249/g.120056  ORF Transcript_46249/g.120056 Transcript_46249/m.120056 type:complete len:219 (+) Transcript_46249:806-1462(+)
MREEAVFEAQGQQLGRGSGHRRRRPRRAEPGVRSLQVLEHLMHVPHLRRRLRAARPAPGARVGPSTSEHLQGLLGRRAPPGVQEPRAAQGAGAAPARLAVDGDHVHDALSTKFACILKEGHELLHQRRAMILDIELRHAAARLDEGLLRVGHLGAAVVHPKVAQVVEGEESGHLSERIADEAVDETCCRGSHGHQVSGYIAQVQVEIVVQVHIPGLLP